MMNFLEMAKAAVFFICILFGTDEILQAIHDAGFQVAMQKEMTLTEEQAREFYKEHEGQDYFPSFISHMTR